jgi:hypothetical protein
MVRSRKTLSTASAIRRCDTFRDPFGAAMMCAAGLRAPTAFEAGRPAACFLAPLMAWLDFLLRMPQISGFNMANVPSGCNGQRGTNLAVHCGEPRVVTCSSFGP